MLFRSLEEVEGLGLTWERVGGGFQMGMGRGVGLRGMEVRCRIRLDMVVEVEEEEEDMECGREDGDREFSFVRFTARPGLEAVG